MSTIEVLTFLLVVLGALSYIDNHNKKIASSTHKIFTLSCSKDMLLSVGTLLL